MKFHVIAITFVAAVLFGCAEDHDNDTNLTGTTGNAEPANHPTEFTGSTITDSSITLTWKDAMGSVPPEHYFIAGGNGTTGIPAPQDGKTPITGNLAQIVKQGVQMATFTKLKSEQTYTFAIYPYRGEAGTINFKVDSTAPKLSATTFENAGMMPLKIGNIWEYTFTITDSNAQSGYSGKTHSGEVFTVINDTILDGKKWYTTRTSSFDECFLRNEDNNLWVLGSFFSQLGVLSPIYFPAPGNLPLNHNTHSLRMVGGLTLTVPAGTFDCYKYELKKLSGSSDKVCYFYIAPTIGVVKIYTEVSNIIVHPNGSGTFVVWTKVNKELKSMSLK